MKRLLDICISSCVLACFAPVLIILGVLIKRSDNGPVFFRQFRVGKNGVLFQLYKLRSMSSVQGADSGRFDAGDSSRVTPIGEFIRRTKLDEIPQFINVIKGEMSIVGPRPEIKKWVDAYPERWAFVHSVKPGITDPASIVFRHEEILLAQAEDPEMYYREVILPEKLAFYEEYVNNQSFFVDILLMYKTFYIVLFK